MNDSMQTPTSDERVMAGISHLMGLVVAFILWAIQKDKSKFVRFQALQAIAFDLLVMVVMFLLVGIMFAFMFGSLALFFILLPLAAEQNSSEITIILTTLIPMLSFCPMGLLIPLAMGIGILRLVAAIRVFTGQDFRYPWLGKLVAKWTGS